MSGSDDTTTMKVKYDTWQKLNQLKKPGDSFDDVLRRMLEKDCGGGDEGNPTRMTPATAD